jgi:hypothetical protein
MDYEKNIPAILLLHQGSSEGHTCFPEQLFSQNLSVILSTLEMIQHVITSRAVSKC